MDAHLGGLQLCQVDTKLAGTPHLPQFGQSIHAQSTGNSSPGFISRPTEAAAYQPEKQVVVV